MSLLYLLNAIDYYEPQGVQVGYLIPSYKKKLLLGEKFCFFSSQEFWYNSLYPYSNLSLQGNISVIINKAVDLLSMEVIKI